ncbi:MAG TPA: uracil-DNA glycosylase family protein [Candidatus Competibacteraceae bacterium]|nr:uracil-DNA glycosylase family protein [Candidatus Competibacteraceae bacterium]
MLDERRRRYLQAMGITLWAPRHPLPGMADAPTPVAPAPPAGEAVLPTASAGDERNAAIARMDWQQLRAAVAACTACPLHRSRTRPVFGVGDTEAALMIIGEAPGAEEDRQGEPFVGRAGKLLDAMLKALGLERRQVFIANILKSRPPNNRDPLPEEVEACWPFLARQIALVQPRLILAVGRIAAQRLLRTEVPVGRLRGRVHRLPDHDIPLVVTYHPAYLLRNPRDKGKAWEDLQLAWHTWRERQPS